MYFRFCVVEKSEDLEKWNNGTYVANIKYFDVDVILTGNITESKAEENRMCAVLNGVWSYGKGIWASHVSHTGKQTSLGTHGWCEVVERQIYKPVLSVIPTFSWSPQGKKIKNAKHG